MARERESAEEWESEINSAERREATVSELNALIRDVEARIEHRRHYAKRSPPYPADLDRIVEIQEFRDELKASDRLVFWTTLYSWLPNPDERSYSAGYAIYRDEQLTAVLVTMIRLVESW